MGIKPSKRAQRRRFAVVVPQGAARGAWGVRLGGGGLPGGPRDGCNSAAVSGPSGGPLCWPKERRFLGCALVPVGFKHPERAPRTRFAVVVPQGAARGAWGVRPGGGGVGCQGAPERGAKVLAFLRLLGAHFVGQKKAAFWGALQ